MKRILQTTELNREQSELVELAGSLLANSYSPYSHYRVGAAVRTRDKATYSGVNVENSSYGLTLCAERCALACAVAHGAQPGDVVSVAIVVSGSEPATPCGACRQVIAELCHPDCEVVAATIGGSKVYQWRIADLLPDAFGLP